MFKKFASVISIEKISIADWRKLIVEASSESNPQSLAVTSEFEVEADKFLYVRVRAVSAGEYFGANQNGDFFAEAELKKSYRTFIRRGVFQNHQSEDPSKAIGIILDAVWHEKEKFVECLLGIDKSEPAAHKIENGIASTWSMGALVKECSCNICDKVATNEMEYCDHLKNHMGREYNGKKVYARNTGLSFYELSLVSVPADPNAYTLQVLAEKQDTLQEKFTVLANKYDASMAKQASTQTTSQAIITSDTITVNEIREHIQHRETIPTDRHVLGTVRHKLRATASPSSQDGDKMRQRIQSALVAGNVKAENMKNQIAENINPVWRNNMDTLSIRYIPGDNLKDCYFIARKGKLQAVISAAEILDPETQKVIEASEAKVVEAAGKVELLKDDSKPTADNLSMQDRTMTKPFAPKMEVNTLSANPATDIKDDSKPTADHVLEMGKEPGQPSEVVKKYAQMVGAKNVTFKTGENGSFTAYLSSGSISRLASLWRTYPKLVAQPAKKEASLGGVPDGIARETALPEAYKKKLAGTPEIAREDVKPLAKPAGNSGSATKSYFQGFNTKDLATGGEEGWARKVNELTKMASNQEATIKALAIENDTLKKALDANKLAQVEEKKSRVIAGLLGFMEKAGAFKVNPDDIISLQEKGLSNRDAQVKAYANMVDRKKAELKQLNLQALETMASNFSEFVPTLNVQASKKNVEIPRVSRDENFGDDADRLSQSW